MGLCKCDKRKVTNQFCFEHRVNVCEFCMVEKHSKCVVQSYLQWLKDSDWDPRCSLCRTSLQLQPCVRLVCYHVFHWSCLDQYALQLPPNTAPAGYTCPTCRQPILPPPNLVSPVADALKLYLDSAQWSSSALSPPMAGVTGNSDMCQSSATVAAHCPAPSRHVHSSLATPSLGDQWSGAGAGASSHSDVSTVNIESSTHYREHFNTGECRKSASECRLLLSDSLVDTGDTKYRHGAPLETLRRWYRKTSAAVRYSRAGARYRLGSPLFLVLAAVVLVALLSLLRWLTTDLNTDFSDPSFDPHFNLNVHVEE